MLTKQEVITRLSSGQRDLTVLQAVVAAKIEKRAQKGQDLHMYTLDLSSLQSKTKREPNVILADLVEDLYQQIPEHAQPMRFQLLIKTSAVHWTAVDVEMSADKVLFLNIDAAGDLSSSIINTLFMQIREKYPNPDLSVCYRLMHEPLSEDSLLPKAIQFGPAGCSTFAMDHLFHTANIDVFRLLEQREETMLNTDNPFDHDDGHPASVFNARNMPPELAVIYRNTESKQVFSVLSEELKSQVINKKGQTLQQAEYKNSWPIWHKNQIKMRNFAMENKRKGFVQDAKNFVEEDPDCLSKIQACDLRKALTDDTFLSSSELVPQKIVRNLIREAKRLDPERTCCDPLGLRQNPSIISAEHELNEGKYDSALEKLEHMPNMTQIYRSNIADIRQRVTQSSALDVSNDESEPLLSGLPKND